MILHDLNIFAYTRLLNAIYDDTVNFRYYHYLARF